MNEDCAFGDHSYRSPHCHCGNVNYPWLGMLGAIARWAKAWGVTKEEAERRIYGPKE